jgi:hypothetical protein
MMSDLGKFFNGFTQWVVGLLLSCLALLVVLGFLAQVSVFNVDYASRVVVKSQFASRLAAQIVNDTTPYMESLQLRPSLVSEALASFDFEEEIVSYLQFRYSDSQLPLDEQAFLNKSKALLREELIVPLMKPDGSYDPLLDLKINEILSQFTLYYRAPFLYTWFDYLLSNLTSLKAVVQWVVVGSLLAMIGLLSWLKLLVKIRIGLITKVVVGFTGLWLLLLGFNWQWLFSKYLQGNVFGALFRTGFEMVAQLIILVGCSFVIVLLMVLVSGVLKKFRADRIEKR